MYDLRANFNFHEHGARVLSLDGPRTKDRATGLQGAEGKEAESQATSYGGGGRPRCY